MLMPADCVVCLLAVSHDTGLVSDMVYRSMTSGMRSTLKLEGTRFCNSLEWSLMGEFFCIFG